MSGLTTHELTVSAVFTALLAASAYIAIPIGTVPFTLQVYVVLLAGMVLGPRLGALSVLAYLLLGLVAPVYSGGTSGLGILLGPTGGYLMGFVAAAWITGAIAATPTASVPRFLLAGLAGVVLIYALGATWLALQLGLSPVTALATGVAPFLWTDTVKVIAAALTARALVNLPLGLPVASMRAR